MRGAYRRVSFYAHENNVPMRIAAYCLALENLNQAYAERGIFP